MTSGSLSLTVQGTGLYPLEHNGQRVVTLAMVDRVHRKANSHQNFNSNRKHFALDDDYFNVNIAYFRLKQFGDNSYARHRDTLQGDDSASVTNDPRWQIPRAGRSLTLLTERGYYKLATTFDDDRSSGLGRNVFTLPCRSARRSQRHLPSQSFSIQRSAQQTMQPPSVSAGKDRSQDQHTSDIATDSPSPWIDLPEEP